MQMWGWSRTDIVTASFRNIVSFSLPQGRMNCTTPNKSLIINHYNNVSTCFTCPAVRRISNKQGHTGHTGQTGQIQSRAEPSRASLPHSLPGTRGVGDPIGGLHHGTKGTAAQRIAQVISGHRLGPSFLNNEAPRAHAAGFMAMQRSQVCCLKWPTLEFFQGVQGLSRSQEARPSKISKILKTLLVPLADVST